ncbi:MAG: efflux RND transporter periplasmic adaptor subunit [Spirochaetaceae bacterium]|jgi:HlyD family secretion protein|nr:efflux RND transporter periplasmic adaptor subunit [Spirochaetaceae bacterium]
MKKPGNFYTVFHCFLFIVALIALCLGTVSCAKVSAATAPAGYEFTAIRKGSIEKTIASTGSLEPLATITVRAQMNSIVEEVLVDYNDIVQKGQLIARLNTDRLVLDREKQQASVLTAQANFDVQQLNYQNQQKLFEKKLISEYELKQAKASMESSQASLLTAEANLKDTDTQINQYAIITSPIDGIVLTRSISAGDSVVGGSTSAGTELFTIAKNLEDMQIEAGVGEMDVSQIFIGQKVRFTLEALPGKTYNGVVANRYLMPTTESNVQTYTVIINVDNKDGSLLPGMTCSLEFIAEQYNDILIVPNAALRYTPSTLAASEAAASNTNQPGMQIMVPGMRMPGTGPRRPAAVSNTSNDSEKKQVQFTPKTIWYLDSDGKLSKLDVMAGVSDGVNTQVESNTSIEGMQVILREKI